MANFLLVIDSDPSRREAVALNAHERVAFLPRLRAELVLAPQYALVWAAAPFAPITRSVANRRDGSDCILFGEPHEVTGATIRADDLQKRRDADWSGMNELNGFYAALMIHPQHGIRAEADVLGMFPLYHWQHGEVLLIGTSPELFRCHPLFPSVVDLHGVAALLLTSGMTGGRTLLKDVRRLPADHVLFARAGDGVREVPPRAQPDDPVATDLDNVVEQAAALHTAFLRSALKSSCQPGLQLSGGLDSRLLAGFTTALGQRPACLTFGRTGDLDARCATQVADELGLSQTLCDVAPSDYSGYANCSVQWEQLSGGLYALPMGWNIASQPPAVEMDRMVCGLTLDAVIGGPKNVASASESLTFERLRIGRLGFDRNRLASLLASPELIRACDDVRQESVQHYLAAGSSDYLREWKMNLEHRHRFAVGTCAWRYSLYAWPVMPALDRTLIQLARHLPHAVVKDRQVQTRMLISKFPRLARLELDRNYLDTAPLVGTKRSLAYDVTRRWVKFNRRCQAWLGRDPRFYVRTMNFNSLGWRVVRSAADQARPAAHSLFRSDELARLVPDANATVRNLQDPIIHSAPLKNTVGLMLWMRQHA